MSSLRDRQQFINYFKNLTNFDRKQFDRYITQAEEFANEFGLDDEDLQVIASASFKQNLASQRIISVINTLIPKTNTPESVVRIVLKWVLFNYNQVYAQRAMQHVLRWLIGLIDYELTNTEVINYYYDCFFYLLTLDHIEAAHLIYLLTKPEDVNRWLVKQLLRMHKTNNHAKMTGVLLYLFKTYRPDCVPENVPAYAVQAVFKKNPNKLTSGFQRAKERCLLSTTIPQGISDIKWDKSLVKNKRNKAVTLVPRLPPMKNLNMRTTDYKSLIRVTNTKDLQKYMLEQNEVTCTLSLLNNSAGYHVLRFSDIGVQSRFSFVLNYVLYDAFIQNNPNVSEDEKNYALNCLAMLQINMQQNVAVVSKIITEFMITWDGHDFIDNLTLLLQFVDFKNYNDLENNLLKYLKIIFISGTLQTKCRILKILGDLAVNIVWDYVFYEKLNYKPIFLDVQPKRDFEDVITNLYAHIKEISELGYYLENGHTLMDHSITNLNDKILSVEKYAQIRVWNVMPLLTYSALFDYTPHFILRICDFLTRHKNSCDPSHISDYMNILFNHQRDVKDSYLNNLFISTNEFLMKFDNFSSCLHINQHMSFKCIKHGNILKDTEDYSAIMQLKELFIFANIYLKNKRQVERRKAQEESTDSEVLEKSRKIEEKKDEIEEKRRQKNKDEIEKPEGATKKSKAEGDKGKTIEKIRKIKGRKSDGIPRKKRRAR